MIAHQSSGTATPSTISWPVGRVHPAVRRQNPEGGGHGADGHDNGRNHLQPARHPAPAEQHDAEEGRLQEKRGQHLVADQRADDVAGEDREAAPVGAELVGQHDPGDDAHRERHREDAGPEPRQPLVAVPAGRDPHHQQRGDIGRQPDGEGREDDVERDRESELQSRDQDRIEFHRHAPPPSRGYDYGTLRDLPMRQNDHRGCGKAAMPNRSAPTAHQRRSCTMTGAARTGRGFANHRNPVRRATCCGTSPEGSKSAVATTSLTPRSPLLLSCRPG